MSAGSIPDAALQERLQRAMRRLPPKRRNIVLLSRVDGLTYEEIAAAYGINQRRVRRHISIGMNMLILEVLHGQLQPWWRRWSP